MNVNCNLDAKYEANLTKNVWLCPQLFNLFIYCMWDKIEENFARSCGMTASFQNCSLNLCSVSLFYLQSLYQELNKHMQATDQVQSSLTLSFKFLLSSYQ